MAIDQSKLDSLLNQFVLDLGATFHAAHVVIGDKLGLYKAMADGGPATSAELAKRTGTAERYVREWLRARPRWVRDLRRDRRPLLAPRGAGFAVAAAAGCPSAASSGDVDDQGRAAGHRGLPQRRGRRLARARSRSLRRRRAILSARLQRQPGERVDPGARRRRRRSSSAVPRWPTSAAGTAPRRSSWPRRTPSSTFVGFDYHEASIERAARRAAEAGVADRVTLRSTPRPADFPGHGLRPRDCVFDACTTWAIRSAPPATSAPRWPTTARGCSSSPTPTTRSTDNLNPVGRCFTGRRR